MEFRRIIESKKEDLAADLAGAIRIPSVLTRDDSGYPYGRPVHDCLVYMLKAAEKLGFSVCNMDEQAGWCEFGEGPEMAAVLCHLDVVPEGEGWTVPPYEGRITEGRIYGRGAMDDKGPAVAALYALWALKESGVPLRRRIRLIFGLNEETGSEDMKYYLKHGGEVPVMGITPDGEYPVINGEKGLVTAAYTKELKDEGEIRLAELSGGEAPNIVPAHARARLLCGEQTAEKILALSMENICCTREADGVTIQASGVSAHGGTPWEGTNAIGLLMQFLNLLPLTGDLKAAVSLLAEKIGTEWNGASLGVFMEDAESGPLTLNLGQISGGSGTVTAKVNYRYPVTKSFEDCGPRIREIFEKAGFTETDLRHKHSLYMSPDSPLVRMLLDVYQRCTGEQAAAKCIGGGTYAKMMPNTLAFGPIFPGDEVREHKPDEFMELSRLLDNAEILAHAMYEMAR